MRFLQLTKTGERVDPDLKDRKLLHCLCQDARMPHTQIAKEVGLSRESIAYRINRLTAQGVIQGYRAVVDISRFGYDAYHIFLRLNHPTKELEEKLIAQFQDYAFARAVLTLRGRYDVELAVVAKNANEFDAILTQVLKDCAEHLQEYDVLIKTQTYAAHTLPQSFHPTKPGTIKKVPLVLDEQDGKILRVLAHDPLLPYFRIAEEIGISHDTVRQRMKRMIDAGVVLKFIPVINYASLSYSVYAILVRMNGLRDDARLRTTLQADKHVLWATKCIGRFDLLMYICVKNTDELNETLSNLRQHFSQSIMDYEVLIAYEEHKYTYFPEYALL
jgi:DNA-binding Lrp family transcriptional regulator